MDGANQIHLTIDTLQGIVDEARKLHGSNPTTSPIVRITKTADRQELDAEDSVEYALLASCSITENLEG